MVHGCTLLCPSPPLSCAVKQKMSVKEVFAHREDCLYLRLTDCGTDQVVEHFRPGRKLALKGACMALCCGWVWSMGEVSGAHCCCDTHSHMQCTVYTTPNMPFLLTLTPTSLSSSSLLSSSLSSPLPSPSENRYFSHSPGPESTRTMTFYSE